MTESYRLVRLSSRALIAVHGPDWRSFLQGLLTQDVETLAPGEARFAALLTPQGKLLYDLFLIAPPTDKKGEDGVWLDVAAEHRADIIQRLTMYRLRAKVEIAADETQVFALLSPAFAGRSGVWVADPRLPALGLRGYGQMESNTDEAAYDAHRLSLGAPGAADWGVAESYPIEANFDLLHGIDFKKGCFVGQETTSRMKRRGQIKSRMVPIRFEGAAPAVGAEILAGDLRAGEVLSGQDGRAMALVRLDRIEGADLTVDGRPVQVETPAWFPEKDPPPLGEVSAKPTEGASAQT